MTQPESKAKEAWTTVWVFLVVVVFIALILIVGTGLPRYGAETEFAGVSIIGAQWRWLIIAGLMVVFLGFLGAGISGGRIDGVFIDSRYKISLSRFQIVLWTVLVLSAYLAIALPRSLGGGLDAVTAEMVDQCVRDVGGSGVEAAEEQVAAAEENLALAEANLAVVTEAADASDERTATAEENVAAAEENLAAAEAELAAAQEATEECVPQPLKITFPPELIMALGISAASFAGASLVQSTKKDKKVKKVRADIEALKARIEEAKEQVAARRVGVDEARGGLQVVRAQAADVSRLPAALERKKEAEKRVADAKAVVEAAPEAERAAAETALNEAQDALATVEEEVQRLQLARAVYEEHRDEVNEKLADAQEKLGAAEQEQVELERELGAAEQDADLIDRNTNVSQASWLDIFRGEEVGNRDMIDLGKVQMFLFTIVVVFSYAVLLWSLLGESSTLRHPLAMNLPAFSASMNTLLTISHAGYLTTKAVRSTPDEVSEEEPAAR
jgi:hypothetical protein